MDKLNVILAGFFCSLAILIETPARRLEMALFIFPRFLEFIIKLIANTGYIKLIGDADILLTSIALGIISYCFHNEEVNIRSPYLTSVKRFFQPADN